MLVVRMMTKLLLLLLVVVMMKLKMVTLMLPTHCR